MERAQARAGLTRRWPLMEAPRLLTSGAALLASIVVVAVLSAGAIAAPGDLDLSLSGDGKQRTDFGFGNSRVAAVAYQPDGKIVAVGFANRPGTSGIDFALARYNPNGSLDPSFSGDGKQTTHFGFRSRGAANGVALQSDGKIVAVGSAGRDFALARYNPNGTLDPSFSGDGKQTTDFGANDDARGVALQGDGKIVVAGNGGSTGTSIDFALARYNTNGSLDTSFSGDGKQKTDFGDSDRASGVAVQGDGKIVAVGETTAGDGDFALARYNTNGSLDTSFSGDGKQTTNFGGSDRARGMALQGDGKIVAVGGTSAGDGEFALARYTTGGSLDTSFSGDGRQTTSLGGQGDPPRVFNQAYGVALQSDGKIVAVGAGLGPNQQTDDFGLARFLGG